MPDAKYRIGDQTRSRESVQSVRPGQASRWHDMTCNVYVGADVSSDASFSSALLAATGDVGRRAWSINLSPGHLGRYFTNTYQLTAHALFASALHPTTTTITVHATRNSPFVELFPFQVNRSPGAPVSFTSAKVRILGNQLNPKPGSRESI